MRRSGRAPRERALRRGERRCRRCAAALAASGARHARRGFHRPPRRHRLGARSRSASSSRSARASASGSFPRWHAPPEPGAINVVLDPGAAFGTGSHPTTRLCLAWLERHAAGRRRVLDYGCGSGILAHRGTEARVPQRRPASTSIRSPSRPRATIPRAMASRSTCVDARDAPSGARRHDHRQHPRQPAAHARSAPRLPDPPGRWIALSGILEEQAGDGDRHLRAVRDARGRRARGRLGPARRAQARTTRC